MSVAKNNTVGRDNTADRELIFTRLLNAPVELVWKMWVSPEHIKLWWGPDGFTNTIRKMQVKAGGEWELTMRGPDGTDHKIKCIFREVVKYKKIVYEQLINFRCIATIEFESRGEQTFLHWQMLFESRDYLIEVTKAYGVDPGLRQTGERMVGYVEQQTIAKHKR